MEALPAATTLPHLPDETFLGFLGVIPAWLADGGR
jgi:hypothetical protein